MYQGSCLCGTVRYEICGEIGPITLCHCSRCRKANGSAFLAAAQVKASEFKVVAGEAALGNFESSPGVYRVFCRNCGSPIISRRPGPPEVIRVRIGTLDSYLKTKPHAHIFFADRAEWFEFEDDVAKYAELPHAKQEGRGEAE
ncbi:MAG TPA: GFA family protein [Steroidobacteraceae bacterium]|nr:GFA family protein [Steroidobacteraceae bacterium]